MNKGHCKCGLILNIFGQMRSTIYQIRAHFAKCICIWPLLVSSTKSAAHLDKCTAQLAKCVRIWPNVAHLVKCRTFRQLVRCASHLAKMRCIFIIYPNAQIGQMRLTKWSQVLAICAEDKSSAILCYSIQQLMPELTISPKG